MSGIWDGGRGPLGPFPRPALVGRGCACAGLFAPAFSRWWPPSCGPRRRPLFGARRVPHLRAGSGARSRRPLLHACGGCAGCGITMCSPRMFGRGCSFCPGRAGLADECAGGRTIAVGRPISWHFPGAARLLMVYSAGARAPGVPALAAPRRLAPRAIFRLAGGGLALACVRGARCVLRAGGARLGTRPSTPASPRPSPIRSGPHRPIVAPSPPGRRLPPRRGWWRGPPGVGCVVGVWWVGVARSLCPLPRGGPWRRPSQVAWCAQPRGATQLSPHRRSRWSPYAPPENR